MRFLSLRHPIPSRRCSRFTLAAVVLACSASGPALAQQTAKQPAAASAPLPEKKTQGALRYTCGGIGLDESTAMRAAMKDHPLSLLFAAGGGDYLADVQVKLVPQGWGDAGALSFSATGPVCLLDLPAGNYEVEATSGDKQKRQTVMVGKEPKTLDFRF
ncbi:hypothetical protein [Paracidovorax cattleyae]|uniref:Carboxypeptidase regulatory-like domain-containing protein n=1 Tax=Paracidovorax cattleyae TaxID=80868 RepID=A0A1H0PST5_9BURK|nr:hypothetical protein [Paracidovorax cattleyae]AVS74424.1 hypothetical protein C8240_10715 [Paracidovorax cattleyae]MBF9263212.1 carboxypeptidase regulatory-like domain-containing protein [Paracidovorax cattleyae]SDP08211.1 hypothetical protein SAMN04489708_10744 [Paracidovorax cattleyae]